jgi:hypothetical protein
MSSRRHDDYDPTAAADRSLYREHARITAGYTAFHQLDPSEALMRMEDYDEGEAILADRAALRAEIFSGFAEYLFADGPDPEEVRTRLEGFFKAFHPELARKIKGEKQWVDRDRIENVLRKHRHKLAALRESARGRGSLFAWNRELQSEPDFEGVRKALVNLVEYMASEGHTWKKLTGVAYAIAKALRPALIAGMSLEDIATLCGDEGRATPCNRIKRLYNRRIEASGGKGTQAPFQKTAATTAKYRTAQLGNSNRSKKQTSKQKHDHGKESHIHRQRHQDPASPEKTTLRSERDRGGHGKQGSQSQREKESRRDRGTEAA